MPIPLKGDPFRDFSLDGFHSAEARAERPLVVFIWKTTCATCRMSIPYFDRLQDMYPGAEIVGVGQETEDDLHDFAVEHEIRFRQLADFDLKVTRRFEVEYVPCYWLTDATGVVLEGGTAWDRERVERIGAMLAEMTGVTPKPVIHSEEAVPSFKPG